MEVYSEYDQAKPMTQAYCQQIRGSEYDKQGAEETERALRELMEYLEKNPEVYKKVLVRRKQEEAENAGIFSYMKCKVLETVKGPDYMEDEVSNDEALHKLGNLQHEIAKVYDYAQEANNSKKRFSRRIAAKKAKATASKKTTPSGKKATPSSRKATPSSRKTTPSSKDTTPANFKKPSKVASSKRKAPRPPAPPPPPPYPPPSISSPSSSDDEVFMRSLLPLTPCRRPPLHPDESMLSVDCSIPVPPPPPPANINRRALKERTNVNNQANLVSPIFKSTPKPPLTPKPSLTPVIHTNLKRSGSTSSLSSIASVHDELLSFDKSRLKSVSTSRNNTPFKTPQSKRVLSASIARASITDICGMSSITFNQVMVEKFRNARSPVTGTNSPASGFNSPTGFTP